METPFGHRKRCYRINEPSHVHFLTFSCFRRQAFLRDYEFSRTCLVEAVIKAKYELGFHVWAYVLMPEHVHILLWHPEPAYSISRWLQFVKQSVSRRVVRHARANDLSMLSLMRTGNREKPHAFWMEGGGYDRNLRSQEAIGQTIRYIHANPVRRGLSSYPEDWPWSSAADWAGVKSGPIPLDKESAQGL